jgi:hypothetical protein
MAIDVAALLTSLLPALNAASLSDADLTFWTSTELYEAADEATKWLARTAGLFVGANTLAAGGSVDVGASFISTIFAAVDGTTLREASVRELEALDGGWETAVGTAKRYTLTGTRTLRLYPAPASGSLEVIEHQLPADITSGNPTLAAATAIGGFLAVSILGAARAKEGDGSMPELAAHCAERISLYGKVFEALYGGDM